MSINRSFVRAAGFLTILLSTLFVNLPNASALQTHGGPEGLYSHQGAHLFLIFSLVVFLLNIKRLQFAQDKAWRLIFLGAFLLTLWNIWAFFGHIIEIYIPGSSFITLPDHSVPSLQINSWLEVIYYILKLDHLLCLPALLFFCAGLTKLQSRFSENGLHNERGEKT